MGFSGASERPCDALDMLAWGGEGVEQLGGWLGRLSSDTVAVGFVVVSLQVVVVFVCASQGGGGFDISISYHAGRFDTTMAIMLVGRLLLQMHTQLTPLILIPATPQYPRQKSPSRSTDS